MMRERYTKPFVLLLMLLARLSLASLVSNVTLPRSVRAIDGKYKYLIFPQGSNVQLIYCLTIGALAKPEGIFTMGVTAGLAYELPYRRTVPYRKPAEVYHRRSRRDLYRKLEIILNTQGKDGRNCVLRALCQAGKRNREPTKTTTSFLEEMLHAVFTFPAHPDAEADEGEEARLRSAEYDRAYSAENECDELFASCPRFF